MPWSAWPFTRNCSRCDFPLCCKRYESKRRAEHHILCNMLHRIPLTGETFSMLRVGYPATLAPELLRDFPSEAELIALPDDLDHEIDIDVWIPDPYPKRAIDRKSVEEGKSVAL